MTSAQCRQNIWHTYIYCTSVPFKLAIIYTSLQTYFSSWTSNFKWNMMRFVLLIIIIYSHKLQWKLLYVFVHITNSPQLPDGCLVNLCQCMSVAHTPHRISFSLGIRFDETHTIFFILNVVVVAFSVSRMCVPLWVGMFYLILRRWRRWVLK